MDLDTTFRDLCAHYFPRWRAAAQWTIREGPRAQWHHGTGMRSTSEQGYCDPANKIIYVQVRWRDLHATIIHEACHAIAGGAHGARWQRRLGQAQAVAAVRGDTLLAASLAADLTSYRLPGLNVSAAVTYGRVEDLLLDVATATLDDVVQSLAYDYSMTPAEVLHRYRRLPYWYARYRREAAALARDQLYGIDHYGLSAALRPYWQERLDALTHEPPPLA
jgi:hypothetical protein